MKVRLLAITALTAATLHAARAQEVTPGSPDDATPSDTEAPSSPEPAPAPAEAPPPAEPAPPPGEPAAAQPMPPPSTAPPPVFGAEGQLVLSVDLPLTDDGPQFALVHSTTTMDGPTTTRIVVRPSADYFVSPSFSLGAELGIDHAWTSSPPPAPGYGNVYYATGGTTLSVEGRVGYDLPVADTVSVWPRLGLGYTHASANYHYSPDVVASSVTLSATMPFLWHPGGHFLLGVGPAASTQLTSKSSIGAASKTTEFGITALIGGTIW